MELTDALKLPKMTFYRAGNSKKKQTQLFLRYVYFNSCMCTFQPFHRPYDKFPYKSLLFGFQQADVSLGFLWSLHCFLVAKLTARS